MRSFDQANNFSIHTLHQTEIQSDSVNGFKLLQEHMVPGAAHDSGERFDAPKCHPNTREAVLKCIRSWVYSRNESKRITWLHGPAGAGKSAIAQTTAERCHENNKLAAAFFFSRLAGRNKKDGLVATIAYQLCVSIPAAREHIIKNIERNPNIFTSNLKAQFKSLVIDPINVVYQKGGSVSPRLIIIDGLDECKNGKDQAEIIDAVVYALSMEHGTRLRVLLASRPELEIRQAFNSELISSLCARLVLDDTFNPDKDIELYIRSHFQTLKRRHTLSSTLPESWPSDDAINQIVKKSSGQFIYASTVIHFVSDLKRDPRKRLDIVLKIKPENGEKPFAQLDALYLGILSMCEDYSNIAPIFEAMMFLIKPSTYPEDDLEILKSTRNLNALLSLDDDILLYLANLHSIVDVVHIEYVGIRFYHASFYDFLVDSSRSKDFYIDEQKAHTNLSLRCFKFLESNATSGLPYIVYTYCWEHCFRHYELSNWEDSVLEFICEKGFLKPDNSQMKLISKTVHFRAQPLLTPQDCTSMLGNFFRSNTKKTLDSMKESARNIIVEEALNHLRQYPQSQDYLLLMLYFFPQDQLTSTLPHLQEDIETTIKEGNNNIFSHDIMYNDDVKRWFRRYINYFPMDILTKSMSCMLEIITNNFDGTWTDSFLLDRINIAFTMIISDINIVVYDGPARRLILTQWKTACQRIGKMGVDKSFRKYGKKNITNNSKNVGSPNVFNMVALWIRSVFKVVRTNNVEKQSGFTKN